jgi:Ca2+-binding RTX toxin-like protein
MNSAQRASNLANYHSLVFIDASVDDYHHLLTGIYAESSVHLLPPDIDGIARITDVLSECNQVESIHIVCHGVPGILYLGNSELSLSTLDRYAWNLQSWFSNCPVSISPSLVLYSCNVANSSAGAELLERLHQLTGATLFASSNPVGNAALGGNWKLNARFGKPGECPPAFQPNVLETYSGVLATGTDGYYRYIDSNESGGQITFNDISSNGGTLLTGLTGDGAKSVALPSGFTFNFYGNNFTTVSIATNGSLLFNFASTSFPNTNGQLPKTPGFTICPFWTDLDIGGTGGGQIYTKEEGSGSNRRFIVQWNNLPHADLQNGDTVTFQVVLYEGSNNIDFVYRDTTLGDAGYNDGQSATIGLNKGTVALQYSSDQASLVGVSSIRFFAEPRITANTLTIKEAETITLTTANLNATDVDNNNTSAISFTVSNVQNGRFLVNNLPANTFTLADIMASRVKFEHNGGELAPSYTVAVSDNYNTAPSQAATISFTNINDIPVLTNLSSSVSLNENAINATPAIIDGSVVLTDVDSPDFDGGNLTVSYTSGASAADQLSVLSAGLISVNGRDISYNGKFIGRTDLVNNGSNGKTLVVNFLGTDATIAAVKAVIESLAYQNISDTPATARTIAVVVNDGDSGSSVAATTTINVAPDNDAPFNTVPGAQTINEDTPLTFVGGTLISIGDPDAASTPVTITLTATNGSLTLSSTNNLSFTEGNGTANSKMIVTGSISAINAALNGMTFTPKANFNGAASVQLETDDRGGSGNGGRLTAASTIDITVLAVNDAPVNTVPIAQSVDEDTNLVFSLVKGNAISIADVDVDEGSRQAQVTLSVTKGTLTLSPVANLANLSFSEGTGTGNAIMTFSGAIADINAVLEGLIYQGNENFNGTDALTITTNDLGNFGDGGIKTDLDTVAITVNPVNDAPVNTIPVAQSIDEDTNLIFSAAKGNAISIADVDVNEGTGKAQVTLSVINGTLTLAQTTGLTFIGGSDGTADPVMTFEGSLTAINAALNGLTYRGNQDFNGSDTLTLITNDLKNFGSGNPGADTDTISITVNPINDAPAVTELVNSVNFNENDLNATPALIDGVVTIVDVDSADFDGGNLTIQYNIGGSVEDQLSIRDQGTGAGQIGFDGTTVTFGGTAIGTVEAAKNGRNGNGFVVQFNTNATTAAVKALLQNLTYQNSSNTPIPSRTISITVNDGDNGTSSPVTTIINVTAQNDAPVLVNNSLTLSEEQTIQIDNTNISATDVDDNPANLVFTVSNVQHGEFRVNGVAATSFTQAQITSNLVRFVHDGGEAPPAYKISVSDGKATTTAQAAAITFTNINDAPTLAGLVSSVNFIGTEVNTTAELIDDSVTVSDVDSADFDGGAVTISYSSGGSSEDQLSFRNEGTGAGQIGFDGTTVTFGGAAIGTIDPANNGSNGTKLIVNFNSSATPEAVKALLQNLTYQNTSDTPIPSRTISITINDGDNGISTAATSVINVASENDPPEITIPNSQTINEDASLTLSGSNRISINDPDAGVSPVQVTLTAVQGTLTLSGTDGLSFATGQGTDNTTMTFTGTLANINKALDGMLFNPTANFNGAASIQIAVNDLGNNGSGGPKTAVNLVNIGVDAVNDAPSIRTPATQTVAEDTILAFTDNNRISISDVDAGNSPLKVSLTVNNGTISLDQTTGLTFSQGNGKADATMVFSGTLASINAAIEGLTYQGNRNYHGFDALNITVDDQGNTGAGGALTTNKTVGISVKPVNDAPINTVPSAQVVNEDTHLVLSSAKGNAISISDPDIDEGTGLAEVTLSVTKGALTLAQSTGLRFSAGDGIADSIMTFKGTVANVNAALDGLSYRGKRNYNGKDTLVITTNDLGNFGGGARTDNDAIDITVKPVNDAPTIAGTPKTSIDQDFPYGFTPVGSDVDGDRLRFTIKNKPGWATFDPIMGRLSGTPGQGNEGTTTGIVIGVSDGARTTALPAFNLTVIGKEISGTTTPDQIVGRDKDDIIKGLDGNDYLLGGEGNDLLYGGSGNDTIFGENGSDTLYGEDGDDALYGGNGDDALYGGVGNDVLFGAEGRDKLYGGNENDLIFGGQDDDQLYGEIGNDTLFGESGNDLLVGDLGDDKLVGGSDRDVLDGGMGRNDLKGGGGKDIFVLHRKGFALIRDFRDRTDKLAVAGVNGKRSFGQMDIHQRGRDTIIEYHNKSIAKLIGVHANVLTKADFVNGV